MDSTIYSEIWKINLLMLYYKNIDCNWSKSINRLSGDFSF